MHNYNRMIHQIQTELDSLFMMLDLQRISVNDCFLSIKSYTEYIPEYIPISIPENVILKLLCFQ